MSKILLIEDNLDILQSIRTMLIEKGYEILIVTKEDEIFSNILSFKPNMILLDVNLNGCNGDNICKGLSNHFKTKQIPVLLFKSQHNITDRYGTRSPENYNDKIFDIQILVDRLNYFNYN